MSSLTLHFCCSFLLALAEKALQVLGSDVRACAVLSRLSLAAVSSFRGRRVWPLGSLRPTRDALGPVSQQGARRSVWKLLPDMNGFRVGLFSF